MRSKYVSVSFNSGIKQQVPATLLPVPFLEQANNLIIKESGRLESRPNFKQLSGAILPAGSGTPIKLFVYNNQLLCVTTTQILTYIKSQNRWDNFFTSLPDSGTIYRRNMELKAWPITQKENDIKYLGFSSLFNQYLVFFYVYDKGTATPGELYYKLWSIPDQRVVGGEKRHSIRGNAITGIYADTDGTSLILGVAYADDIRIQKFNPVNGAVTFNWQPGTPIPGIKRFEIRGGRLFYTLDGTNVVSVLYDSTIPEEDRAPTDAVTSLPIGERTSSDYSNRTLYDFQDWVEFTYSPIVGEDESFKIVWSIQTGYFIINENNRLVGHLYGNFTPYYKATPPRMEYFGKAFQVGGKVYIPILRSGQTEVVNRSAIVDRIVPGGQELAIFRPLGLELLELDFASRIPPQIEQIDQQALISGPLLSWTDGQGVSEYSFTEKPLIEKTPSTDYDRWPYSELDHTLPDVTELTRDQFTEQNLTFEAKRAPYTVDTLGFTASTNTNLVGLTKQSDWNAASTAAKRLLRFSTSPTDGTASDSYGGRIERVYYDSTEKALIAEFFGAPSSLMGDKAHPQAIILNGIRYDFHYWDQAGSFVPRAFHFVDENPLTSGTTYTLSIPRSNVLQSVGNTAVVQEANADNSQTEIQLNEAKLREFKSVIASDTAVAEENLNTALLRFGALNKAAFRGIVKTALKSLLVTPLTLTERSFYYDPSASVWGNFDIQNYASLYSRIRLIDAWVIGDWLWTNYHDIFGGTPSRILIWKLTNGRRTDPYAFRLSNLNRRISVDGFTNLSNFQGLTTYRKPFVIGNTFWVLGIPYRQYAQISTGDVYRAYDKDAGSGVGVTYNSSKNLDLGNYISGLSLSFPVRNAFTIDNTVWINLNATSVSNNERKYLAFDISGSTWTRASSKDLTLPFDSDRSIKTRGNSNVVAFRRSSTLWSAYIWSGTAWSANVAYDVITTSIDNPAGSVMFSNGDKAFIHDYISSTVGYRFYAFTGEPDRTLSDGTISSALIADNMSLEAAWTILQRREVYFVISAPKTAYATSALLHTQFTTAIKGLTFSAGTNSYTYDLPSNFASSDLVARSDTNNVYMRYRLRDFAGVALLRTIIADNSLLTGTSLNITFIRKAGTSFGEVVTDVEPAKLSLVYSGFNENDQPKALTANDVNFNALFFSSVDRNIRNPFLLSRDSFVKSKGAVQANNYYYAETRDNPLPIVPTLFMFGTSPENSLIFRYALVSANPVVTADAALSAHVYNYKCQFKWQDENGLEHRSQFSNIIQIVTNTPIGTEGNQPSFFVRCLNLTNKLAGSVAIEIYRTKDKATTFQFLKEVTSLVRNNTIRVVDDVEDDGLGAPAGPDNILLSGASFVTAYKGRYVLYGFPDKPNRIIISSPRRPFSNDAIKFRQSNLPGDLIELLMEQAVVSVRAMDDYLLIFCERQAYVWSINEGSVAQQNPQPVTGLSQLTADSYNSSVDVSAGILFNASQGQGIHLISRGLNWNFEGEPVKRIFEKGRLLDSVKKKDSEDVVLLRGTSETDDNEPKVIVYNQRYKQWTTLGDQNLLSAVIWDNRLTALNEQGEIWQEDTTPRQATELFTVQTGWINFTGGYMNFQRLRDIYLLMEADDLTSLDMTLEYDFIAGNLQETINVISPTNRDQQFMVGGERIRLRDKKEWRFQPRQRKCSSVRIKIDVVAKSVKFDSLRFGIDAGAGISGQSHQVSTRVNN